MIIEVRNIGVLDGEPLGRIHFTGGTIGELMDRRAKGWRELAIQPVVISIDGEDVCVSDWDKTYLRENNKVLIERVPQGGLVKALGSIIGSIFNFALGWLMPSARSSTHNTLPQGQRLEASQVKANTARLGGTVPEGAGTWKHYVDYLTPPRRHFSTERQQVLEFLGCLGVGHYDVQPRDVRIGNTPIADMQGTTINIHDPNADLTAYSAADFWHTVDEVGGTSSGTAGLELTVDLANANNSNPASYVFNGLTITRPSGSFPVGWGAMTRVEIVYPREYTKSRGEVGTESYRTLYRGYFGHIDATKLSITNNSIRYNAIIIGDLGDGVLTIAYREVGSTSNWYYDGSSGTTTYTSSYSTSEYWTIANVTDTVVTLQPQDGLVFEYGETVEGAQVNFNALSYGQFTNNYTSTPGKEKTSLVEVDLFFPNGLSFIDNDTVLQNQTAYVEVQISDLDNPSYQESHIKIYTRNTNDQIGFSEQFTMPYPMRARVRLRRIGARSVSTQVNDTVNWFGLKSKLPIVKRYPRWTTATVTVQSGGKLAAQSENQINIIATRKLSVLENGAWTQDLRATRDISAFVRYVSHGVGYNDNDIDMVELIRLHDTYWKPRNETLNYVFDASTAKAVLDTALAAGMSELTIERGKIRPVRDVPRTVFEQSYSAQNMTRQLSYTAKQHDHDDFDGVEVEYVSEDSFDTAVVPCMLPWDQGFKIRKIKINGVTNRTQAYRIGMRLRGVLEYQRKDFSFSTEMDALNSRYLSYVALIPDDIEYGQSSLITKVMDGGGDAFITISETPLFVDGEDHVFAYRNRQGKLVGPFEVSGIIGNNTLIVDMPKPYPVSELKPEFLQAYFGTKKRWSYPALIKDISPSRSGNTTTATVKAVNYDARVYAYDNELPEDIQ